ncbi:dihydrodipicolinate synthetase [Stutzerimonas stutzeri]|uniref:Dihydrodipicolinate synthetase n=1 Tax=Stutzerimonas stutzeri TaxID=316 RepID=W8RG89_STUST|nr:dihydrodipicolinate synthase family protein [Stutzerimonas stutzeri]AHL77512.1 dihydrodipicolinate synthetase [Stutzerimonas stutzeri]MCQ4330410.1 dihydrodipicolinate synthase family protein [Stutzerimonas stutzeri]
MGQDRGHVLSPVITPFGADLSPDTKRFVAHCRWLLDQDVGLAVFGTNSEANSLVAGEKIRLLDALIDAGVPAARLMPGTGSCALPDTVAQTRHATAMGVKGVLMLPPFFYKGVSDEGLFRYYSEVIERVGDERLRIYLYHIPPVSQVPLSLALIERLLRAYPNNIAGLKDSSGDWTNTQAVIEQFGQDGFEVYAGSEAFLLQTLRAGGAGCISATANVNPGPIARLAKDWQASDADEQQAALVRTRKIFERFPVISALKAATARFSGDEQWAQLRPPLVELNEQQRGELFALLDDAGFDMPGLK